MDMNIHEFIRTQYPIEEKVKNILVDPYKRIMEMDDLPYDKIGHDESGMITKLVEVDETTFVPVLDLISYTETEAKENDNKAFYDVWKAYMDSIDIDDLNVIDMLESAKRYRTWSDKRKDQLDVLSL